MVNKMNKSKEFWDRASKNYDKTEERFEYIHSKSRENTKKYLNGSNIVLDYGCGTGTTSCEIANLVKEIHAIDISSKMIEIATKEFIREWFWRRFKRSPDYDPMYFKEWLNRFDEYQGRSVRSYMDKDSRKYLDILIKQREF